jgi:hypothetical protein
MYNFKELPVCIDRCFHSVVLLIVNWLSRAKEQNVVAAKTRLLIDFV